MVNSLTIFSNVNMTDSNHDEEWLAKQIRIAVDGYLEDNFSEISSKITEEVMAQLVAEGKNRGPEGGKIVIELKY